MKSTKKNLVKYHYLFSKVDERFCKTEQHIPHIIHQTGKSQTDLPADISKNIEMLKLLNPDWEYLHRAGGVVGFAKKIVNRILKK